MSSLSEHEESTAEARQLEFLHEESMAETRQLVFSQNDNSFYYDDATGHGHRHLYSSNTSAPVVGRLDQLVVWGGCVANCGESALSRLVDSRHDQLQSLTYAPDRTKGGALIRPKYHAGDRDGTQIFLRLERMAIRLIPYLMPWEYGWQTPALAELTLLFDPFDGSATMFRRILVAWLSRMGASAADGTDELRTHCPQLHAVHVDLYRSTDHTRTQQRLLTLAWPRRVPWAVQRLLHLAASKPDPDVEADSAVERCHDALRQALPLLLPLLHEPGWTCHVRETPPNVEELRASDHEEATHEEAPHKEDEDIEASGIGPWTWPHEGDTADEVAERLSAWVQTLSKREHG